MKATSRVRTDHGFSLVELLVSMAILTAIMLLFVGVLDQTQKTWDYAQGQISQFREARTAFDIMTKNISQATLNTYYEQVDRNGDDTPEDYIPKSELHFVVLQEASDLRIPGYEQVGPGQAIFFQAPLGVSNWTGGSDDINPETGRPYPDLTPLSNLLTSRGYFVAYSGDKDFRPQFLTTVLNLPERKRYRLMEFTPPSEANKIYFDYAEEEGFAGEPGPDPDDLHFNKWYRHTSDLAEYSRPLAENIVALVISPREPLADEADAGRDLSPAQIDREMTRQIAPNFEYNSEDPDANHGRHELPPLVKITMIALDETSAIRLDAQFNERPYMKPGAVGTGRGLMPKANWLKAADNLSSDLEDFSELLEEEMYSESGARIRYKIFSTTINIKGSKWQAQ